MLFAGFGSFVSLNVRCCRRRPSPGAPSRNKSRKPSLRSLPRVSGRVIPKLSHSLLILSHLRGWIIPRTDVRGDDSMSFLSFNKVTLQLVSRGDASIRSGVSRVFVNLSPIRGNFTRLPDFWRFGWYFDMCRRWHHASLNQQTASSS